MNFQNDRYTLRFAEDCDNESISRIFSSGSFSGDLDIQFLRSDQPMSSFRADGEPRIMVTTDNNDGSIIAVGGAVVRDEYVNGRAEKCAYLTGLKVLQSYRGRLSFIAKAYQFLGDHLEDCRCCYSTILDSNKPVIAMMEKRHRNMPEYRFISHYTTYCWSSRKAVMQLDNCTAGFDELMDRYFSRRDLTPVDPYMQGFGKQTFWCFRDGGSIKACCFVGDQQNTKFYKLKSYGGVYRFISKLPTQLLGYPAFPAEGSIIDHGVVSYLYVDNCDRNLCSSFLRSVAALSGHSLLIWGGADDDPLCRCLDSMKTVRYGSRLYQVIWSGSQPELCDTGVEAALL